MTEGENKVGHEETKVHSVLNTYMYDAFGNTVACEEQVPNRFRYLGEQHDSITQQYYLRARYYNPVIARFTQEDTYYGDGLNLYQYCANNPVRYKEPSGHCAKEQNAYQRYVDVGADMITAEVVGEAYPNLASKLEIVKKYRREGYNPADALMLADYEIIHGTDKAASFAEKNVKKIQPAFTPTQDINTNWRALERLDPFYGDMESRHSMSDLDTRKWYLAQDAKIPDLFDQNLSLKAQAMQAFNLRNQARTKAREYMAELVQKQKDKGILNENDIYLAIIASAQRSRTSVNKSLGLE